MELSLDLLIGVLPYGRLVCMRTFGEWEVQAAFPARARPWFVQWASLEPEPTGYARRPANPRNRGRPRPVALLREAGMVGSQKKGTTITYQLNALALEEVLANLADALDLGLPRRTTRGRRTD